MNTDKLEVLQEMYSLCIQNRKEEKKKIQTNLDRISEIDAYIKSIKESEEADLADGFADDSSGTVFCLSVDIGTVEISGLRASDFTGGMLSVMSAISSLFL